MDPSGSGNESGSGAHEESRTVPHELGQFFAIAPDLLCITDHEGRFVELNPAWGATLGYHIEDMRGRKCTDFVHPEDRTATAERLVRVARGAQDNFVNRYRHADGSYRWFEWHSSRQGNVIYGAARDVSERKAAEQALRESEERFRAAIEAIPIAIVAYDGDRLVLANAAATRLTGFSNDEILAPEFPQRVIGADSIDELVARSAARLRGEPVASTYTFSLTRKDGQARTFEASTTIVSLGGRQLEFVAASDVTERNRYEQRLRQVNEELEERVALRTAALAEAKERAEAADQAKSALLSRASHELRTPLNSILGFAQLLALDGLPPSQSESVEHILNAGSHLLGLVDEVLDITQIETGRLALTLEPTDLNKLVYEAIELVAPLAQDRGVTVEWQSAPGSGPWAHTDFQRLKQVLLNLLSNAIKYNRENGTVSVRTYETDGGKLRIAVADTGPGIAPGELSLLFNPFERLGAEVTEVQGTGLGLSLSRALTEAMGGTIGVESEPGTGSTFWVDLASGKPPPQTAMTTSAAPATVDIPPPPDRPRQVLYIEDNLANLKLVESLLKRWNNVTLIPATQGRAGLELAASLPDLIVLDVHLPDLPGEEVLRQLKADPVTRQIPVIVASADATQEQIDRMVGGGALHYFTKPLAVRQFLAALSQVFGSAEGGGASRAES